MADDTTKKVIIPKDKNGDGKLGNDFTDYRALYGNNGSQQDDIPADAQPPQGNVTPVSHRSARQRAGQDSQLNKNQIGTTEALTSDDQYLPEVDKPGTINRPSQTITLGQFIKKGRLGQRVTKENIETVIAGSPVVMQHGDELLKNIITPILGSDDAKPFGRQVKGTPGDLYNSDNDHPGGAIIDKTISTVLKQNRFSSVAESHEPFAKSDQNPDEAVFTSMQSEVGAYNPNSENSINKDLTLDDMKDVALDLIHEAMGLRDGDSFNLEVASGFATVNASNIRPKNMSGIGPVGHKTFDASKASTGEFNEPGDIRSFGHLNSPDNPFDGFMPIEMVGTALGMVVATGAIVGAGSLLLGLADGLGTSKSAPGPKPLTMGSYKEQLPKAWFGSFAENVVSKSDLGFVETKARLSDAVQQGVKVFLGVDEGVTNFVQALANITRSPGYYVTFCRAVMRDRIIMEQKHRSLQGQEVSAGVAGALTYLDILKSSKLVAATNAMAVIGDSAITKLESPYKVDKLPISDDVPAMHAMKSRDGEGTGESATSLRLAWRGSSTPSMYLLPTSIPGAMGLASNSSLSGVKNLLGSEGVVKKGTNGRISKEAVALHEQKLDAEYVPFYFHDLRTNEIVSFHAFLSRLTDDYSPRYNAVRAIGRADPVRIYQNTDRSIRFTFYAVATSREDFDEMWYKINKLVTLAYPQYTAGRTVESKDKKSSWTMPFSQVQSASPMIRLRIGDVIRSNYSRFNLGRLFGLGTDSLMKDSAKHDAVITEYDKLSDEKFDKVKTAVKKAKTNGGLEKDDVVLLTYPNVQYLEKVPKNKGSNFDAVSGFRSQSTRYYLPYRDVYAKIVKKDASYEILPGLFGIKKTAMYEVELFNDINLITSLTKGINYLMSHHDATIIPSEISSVKKEIDDSIDSSTITSKMTAAFDDFIKKGAVARSFEESGGRGLPGFVSSLSFSWIDNNTTWEVEPGARAPKVCEITISFDPVHDIAPGLDAQGFNRAPTYQVGSISNEIVGDTDHIASADAKRIPGNNASDEELKGQKGKYNSDTRQISTKMNTDDFRS
jgi:hypothetical protein